MTQFASVLGVPLEAAAMELRATFPREGKFGLRADVGAAMERLDYVIDVKSAARAEEVAELMTAATRACHAENSLRVPVAVEPVLRLNGVEVPFEQPPRPS